MKQKKIVRENGNEKEKFSVGLVTMDEELFSERKQLRRMTDEFTWLLLVGVDCDFSNKVSENFVVSFFPHSCSTTDSSQQL